MNFKPMLSATLANPELLPYPVMVSPKLDGLRCLTSPAGAISRNLKPFRNKFVQEELRGLAAGLDGELIVGAPNEGHVLNRTQSGIMSSDGEPDFKLYVFDIYLGPNRRFTERHAELYTIKHPRVEVVNHYAIYNADEFAKFEASYLELGYEGIMVRGLHAGYKFGRATNNEQSLWKFKRFTDGEALITAVDEGVHNENEAIVDALGRTKRSNHQDGKVGSGRVGTIHGTRLDNGAPIVLSPGRMTQDMREYYWGHQNEIVGKVAKYKSFEYGRLNASRFATFQDFRHPADMDAAPNL